MRGSPTSPHPSQQKDYVKHTKNGQVVDKNGNPTDRVSENSHIEKSKFKFK